MEQELSASDVVELIEQVLDPKTVSEIRQLRERLKEASPNDEYEIKRRLTEIIAGIPLEGEKYAFIVHFLLAGPC